MTTHQYRLDAEDAVRAKEKGHAEAQPTSKTTAVNSTAAERGIYNPLTWRPAAISRKRGAYGHIDPLLVAWLIVGSALLLVLIAEVATWK